MKKTIVFLLILIGLFSEAQVLQLDNTYGREMHRLYVRTLMGLPKDTFAVPVSLQDIPFIANKAGTIYTWNITTHVWDALSAGGGGSTIYTADGQILTDRTIDLNGKFIKFSSAGIDWLKVAVDDEEVLLASHNPTGSNNEAKIIMSTTNIDAISEFIADFDGGTAFAQIVAEADVSGGRLTLTADSIRFLHNNITSDTSANYVQTIDKSTGTIGKAFFPSGGAADGNGIYGGSGTLPSAVAVDLNSNTLNFNQGVNSFLKIDPSLNNEVVEIQSFNNTAGGNWSLFQLSNTANGSTFNLNAVFDGGAKQTTINGNAITGQATSLSFTADTSSFFGDVHIRPAFRLRLGQFSADLSTPSNGDLFYNSTSNKFRAYENGAWTNLIGGTVTNVATGLGLSGGPITTTGTLLVDTANASILSRQRAAATYQPLGAITTLNTLTDASQSFAVGSTGTDFNIASAAGVHTFHIPDAAAAARGFVNTGSQTFAGSKTLTGFTNLTGGHASSTVAGNSNLYVTGGTVANRTTVAAFLPESAAGLGGKVFINGSTAYTMTASDAFSALTVASNLVTEAASGTHPLISALVLNAPVVTNGAGATANMATLYINAAPSGVTPTGATYAQWIKAGGLRLGGDIIVDKTITAAGTTGNQTINKLAGTVNIAAAGTTVTVTNSFCATTSIVFAVIRTNDSTAVLKNVVPGAGSFVINLTAAANAEVSIGFLVTN